jgi:PAS domain S-box-containing protein
VARTHDLLPETSNVATRVESITQDADLSWVVDLLGERRDEILAGWLDAAADQPFHRARSERAVADHIPALFDALVHLLTRYSDPSRSAGVPLEDPHVLAAAQSHARVRFEQGFTGPDVATEFRLLRQEIGRALRRYVSDRSPTTDVVGAELLLHDALDGAVFLALTVLNEHEVARRKAEAALRESEESFRLLVESVEDYAIFTLTPDGRVASWNAGARRTLGYDREAIVGLPVARLFTEEDVAAGVPQRLLAAAAADGHAVGDGERQRADGSRLHADAALTALRDDSAAIVGFAMVMHDVTARRRIEEERAATTREREAFFSTLSHDLRTPLATATAIAQLLRIQASKGALEPAHLVGRLQSIEGALRRGALRVDELMDLARREGSEASTPQTGPVDLVLVTSDLVARYRMADDRHEFVFTTSVDSLVGAWDRDGVERSIDNLLSNAVKFSPQGGRISAAVSEERSDDARVAVITIVDQGMGIPEDEHDAIFARLRRGSNVGEVPGSGIGLWSVRRIVEQHGGWLAVESRLGQGSTFTMRLPIAPAGRTPAHH